MIDLCYREVEDDLRASVRAMLADRCPWGRVLARCEGDEPYDRELWRTLAADMGLASLAVPEEYGGAGASLREAAVVVEELGRAVAPVPYLGSAVMATSALVALDAGDLLGELATGAVRAALVVPLATAPGDPAVPGAPVRVDGGALTGTVPAVADAWDADILLVPAADAAGAAAFGAGAIDAAAIGAGGLYAVPGTAAGVRYRPVGSLDLTRRLCDLTLDGTPGRLLATGADAERAVRAALTAGAALLAAEQLGVAEWCLESTVDYVKSRYQFGRPVGSFQAVKHRLADVWVEVTQARAVARYAAACVAEQDADAAVATALAQAYCSGVAVAAAEECVQLHGGIGFTWEHPAHLYLKRAKASAIALGTAGRHRAALATLVELPAAAGAEPDRS